MDFLTGIMIYQRLLTRVGADGSGMENISAPTFPARRTVPLLSIVIKHRCGCEMIFAARARTLSLMVKKYKRGSCMVCFIAMARTLDRRLLMLMVSKNGTSMVCAIARDQMAKISVLRSSARMGHRYGFSAASAIAQEGAIRVASVPWVKPQHMVKTSVPRSFALMVREDGTNTVCATVRD